MPDQDKSTGPGTAGDPYPWQSGEVEVGGEEAGGYGTVTRVITH